MFAAAVAATVVAVAGDAAAAAAAAAALVRSREEGVQANPTTKAAAPPGINQMGSKNILKHVPLAVGPLGAPWKKQELPSRHS